MNSVNSIGNIRKINIDPDKELFKWGPISVKFIYPSGFIFGILTKISKYYEWPWPANISFLRSGKEFIWVNEYLELQATGLKYFNKYLLIKKNYNELWNRWKDWIREYEIFEDHLKKRLSRPISQAELIKEVKKMSQLVLSFWLIVHVPEIANWGGEQFLKKELEKIDFKRRDKYLEILSAPVKFSFFQKEELELLKLADIKDKKVLATRLKEHARCWHWILNSYGGNRVLTPKYFKERLEELTNGSGGEKKTKEIEDNISCNKRRKFDLVSKLKLSNKMVLVSEQLSESIWWQDLRKGYIWRQNHLWDLILKIVAKKTPWKFSELQWCFFYEIEKVLKGKINKELVLRRKKNYIFYGEDCKIVEIFNKQTFDELWNIYVEEKIKGIKEMKGLVVSHGKDKIVKGRARVITDPFREQLKFKEGEILVASMTSPEYIVVMKKARAIITNYGGMTCHAAIVSRELGVPCLVNTRQATKTIKDGDLVEIDTEKGIVKILN